MGESTSLGDIAGESMRGRPKIGSKLPVALTPDQRAGLDALAKLWGVKKSEIVRSLIDALLKKQRPIKTS